MTSNQMLLYTPPFGKMNESIQRCWQGSGAEGVLLTTSWTQTDAAIPGGNLAVLTDLQNA